MHRVLGTFKEPKWSWGRVFEVGSWRQNSAKPAALAGALLDAPTHHQDGNAMEKDLAPGGGLL
jgi:hypothetical protein